MQGEVTAVLKEAGIVPDKAKSNQLTQAIIKLIDDRVGSSTPTSTGVTEARVIELIKEHAVLWG